MSGGGAKKFTVAGIVIGLDPLSGKGLVETQRFGVIGFTKGAVDRRISEPLSIGSRVAVMATGGPDWPTTQSGGGGAHFSSSAIWHVTFVGLIKDAKTGVGIVVDRHEKFGFLEDVVVPDSGNATSSARRIEPSSRIFFPGSVIANYGLSLRDVSKVLRNGDIVQYTAFYNPERDHKCEETSYTALRVSLVYKYSTHMKGAVGIVQETDNNDSGLAVWVNGIGEVYVARDVYYDASKVSSRGWVLGDRVQLAFEPCGNSMAVSGGQGNWIANVSDICCLDTKKSLFVLGGAQEGLVHAACAQEDGVYSDRRNVPHEVFNNAEEIRRLPLAPSRMAVASFPDVVEHDRGTHFGVGIIGTLARRFGFFWSPDCGLTFFRTSHCPQVQHCLYEQFRSLGLVKFEAKWQEPVGECSWQATRVETLDSPSDSEFERFQSFVHTEGTVTSYSNGHTGFINTKNIGVLSFTSAELPLRTRNLSDVLAVGETVRLVLYPAATGERVSNSCKKYRVLCFPHLQEVLLHRWQAAQYRVRELTKATDTQTQNLVLSGSSTTDIAVSNVVVAPCNGGVVSGELKVSTQSSRCLVQPWGLANSGVDRLDLLDQGLPSANRPLSVLEEVEPINGVSVSEVYDVHADSPKVTSQWETRLNNGSFTDGSGSVSLENNPPANMNTDLISFAGKPSENKLLTDGRRHVSLANNREDETVMNNTPISIRDAPDSEENSATYSSSCSMHSHGNGFPSDDSPVMICTDSPFAPACPIEPIGFGGSQIAQLGPEEQANGVGDENDPPNGSLYSSFSRLGDTGQLEKVGGCTFQGPAIESSNSSGAVVNGVVTPDRMIRLPESTKVTSFQDFSVPVGGGSDVRLRLLPQQSAPRLSPAFSASIRPTAPVRPFMPKPRLCGLKDTHYFHCSGNTSTVALDGSCDSLFSGLHANAEPPTEFSDIMTVGSLRGNYKTNLDTLAVSPFSHNSTTGASFSPEHGPLIGSYCGSQGPGSSLQHSIMPDVIEDEIQEDTIEEITMPEAAQREEASDETTQIRDTLLGDDGLWTQLCLNFPLEVRKMFQLGKDMVPVGFLLELVMKDDTVWSYVCGQHPNIVRLMMTHSCE